MTTELTEEQLAQKLQDKQQAKVQEFLGEFETLSKKHGFTFGGRAVIQDNGTIGVQIVPVKRQ